MKKKLLKREELISYFRKLADDAGSQKVLAERLEVGQAYLSDLLKGRREFTDPVLSRAGIRRTEVFEVQ